MGGVCAAIIVNDFGKSLAGQGSDEGVATKVTAAIKAAGGDAFANSADVSDADGANSVIADAIEQFGRIDAVVNNAGISRDVIFHKMSHQDWLAVISVQLTGCFNISRAAAPFFREQNSGSLVHMTSTSGLIGNVGQANYSAAKMGIVGLSNSIALDMNRFGVRSNCIAPFAWSRMTDSIPENSPSAKERVKRLKSMTADKVAPLTAYLCSDSSAEVSGQIFCVRRNEIFLFQMPRPVRSMHREEGWTVESIANDLIPAFEPSLSPLEVSGQVFSWDPI
ncbi:MAG: SDR family oxidoreductase [Gammaproteobacteria bacterium]|nr:SDR family oxidoreductase [Gammaproteobacteria bacterium]